MLWTRPVCHQTWIFPYETLSPVFSLSTLPFGLPHSPDNKIAHLEKTIQGLRDHLATTQQFATDTLEKLGVELASSQQTVDSLTKVLRAYHWKHQCETLYADGYVIRGAQFLLEIMRSAGGDVGADSIITDWISGRDPHHGAENSIQLLCLGFTNKCVMTLERIGDELSGTEKHDERLAAYTTALTLDPSSSNILLEKWAKTTLLHESASKALEGAKEVCISRHSDLRR